MSTDNEEFESSWKTVDLDNLDNDQEDQDDQDNDNQDDQDDQDDDDQDGNQEAKQEDKKENVRKSRAKDRINQLVKEKNEEKRIREELEARVAELENTHVSTKKEGLKSQINLIDSNIEAVKRDLRRATEDGDTESILDLQDKLSDLKLDRRVAEAQESKLSVPKKAPEQQQSQQQQVDLPDEMKYWLQDNEWAVRPSNREERKKVMTVKKIAAELVQDGYSEFEPDFYDELDARLEKSFGKSDKDVLEYEQKDDNSSGQTENRQRQRKQSPVSGSSGAAPASGSKRTPKPTEEDRQIARRLNLDINQYMKSKARYEQTQKEDNVGWVNVF